ncbi:MAG: ADP-forming succinate--CoA ligase subunit beta [Nitrospinota bacterium]|nr:ADP-forming succinate--CoA ligase subunit beta [Nitrospinota bacterium]
MKIHEYQAKEVLRKYGIPVPEGFMTEVNDNAGELAGKLGGFPVVVKAQIHAGGRGKGGGVKLAHSADEAESHAKSILGMTLVTHQTGPEGKKVKKLLIEAGCKIERELYIGIVQDRESSRNVIMASTEGGMEIEEVAAATPEKILKVYVDPAIGIMPYQARQLAFGLSFPAELIGEASKFIMKLYNAFVSEDLDMAEINPMVQTKDGKILALDAKLGYEDNALFRHKDALGYRDLNEEDPLEIEASKYNLNYIKLDGNIGCMVNGAGLAMGTMDIIKHSGGEPANFLDVGGGASEEQIEEALKIIVSDDTVKAIFINIFGGILRCDRLANGVVNAARKINIKVPIVIRMEGTNVEEGRAILAKSGLNFIIGNGMRDGAQKAVAALKGN